MTGASTLWTLLSSMRISLALSHRLLTSDSFRYSHFLSRSICSSRSEKEDMLDRHYMAKPIAETNYN